MVVAQDESIACCKVRYNGKTGLVNLQATKHDEEHIIQPTHRPLPCRYQTSWPGKVKVATLLDSHKGAPHRARIGPEIRRIWGLCARAQPAGARVNLWILTAPGIVPAGNWYTTAKALDAFSTPTSLPATTVPVWCCRRVRARR